MAQVSRVARHGVARVSVYLLGGTTVHVWLCGIMRTALEGPPKLVTKQTSKNMTKTTSLVGVP